MKKLLLIFSCIFLSVGLVYSQRSITATGTVIDDTGIEVVGASVVLKGTTTGVAPDIDGKFSLNVPEGGTLVFTLIGMETVEAKATTNMKVVMNNDEELLEEVVVVAYGTVKKGAFTGSAAVVDNSIITKTPVTSFEKALEGASPGIQVTSTTGQPGAATNVRIRGIGSISGDSSPLYVIDGVPIQSSSNSSGRKGSDSDFSRVGDTYNPLSSLNSEDIASLTVLKDASAASLYGSRAANGVILITTKKGAAGKAKINFKSQFGVSKRPNRGYDFMSGGQIYKHYWDGAMLASEGNGKTAAERAIAANTEAKGSFSGFNPYNYINPINADGNLATFQNANGQDEIARLMYDTDWMDEVYRTGKSQQYDLSISGGNTATQYYVGLGYLKQDGIVIASGLERYSGRVNLTTEAASWLKVGANTTFSLTDQSTPNSDGGGSSAIVHSMAMPGTIPMYQLDDDFQIKHDPLTGEALYNYKNPIYNNMNGVDLAKRDKYKTRTYRALINPWAEVRPIQNLVWTTNMAYDYNNMDETQWYNQHYGNAASQNGRLYKYSIWNNTMTLSTNAAYDYKLLDDHHFNFMVGAEFYNNTMKRIMSHSSGFPPAFDIIEIGAGAVPEKGESVTRKENMNSFFGRLNYDYLEKYYLSFSLRTDGSSRFGKDNKYGTFWSVGGNWRISSEDMMASTRDWLHDLKLRASYGSSGAKDGIGRYDSYGLYLSGFNYVRYPGVLWNQLANPNLKWEKSMNLNVGIDYNLFGRVYGSLEVFQKKSSDMLLSLPLAPSVGLSTYTVNQGNVKNTGLEFSATSVNVRTPDFLWETSFNLTHVKTEIYDYPLKESVRSYHIWTDGYSMNEFYMQEWAGVDKQTGAPLWYKDVKDPETGKVIGRETTSQYTAATKYKQGSGNPTLFGSLSNSLSYKGLDFSFMFTYQFGGKIYDAYEEFFLNDGAKKGHQMVVEALDSWTPDNVNASNPKFVIGNTSNSNKISSRFLHKSDFIKFKNITLGYTLPKRLTSKVFINSVRLFGSVENVALWTLDSDYKGYDPELAGANGLLDGRGTVAIPRTVLFGLSLTL